MKKFVSRGIDMIRHAINIRWESPIGIWKKYGKPYFKFPKINLLFYIRNKNEVKYYRPAIVFDVVAQDISWKSKYGNLEFEQSPFIRFSLFKRLVFQIDFVAPANNDKYDDICYWEGLLSMMSCTDSNTNEWKVKKDDALLKTYKENIWTDYGNAKYTIEPYLTNLGWHILQSKLGRFT